MNKILVTGASGFVGSNICSFLRARNANFVAATRNACADSVAIGDIDGGTNWETALAGVDVVIHAAARVHVMKESAAESLELYRTVNVAGTVNLANQAVLAGVRRFVFISSIKVNGESTFLGSPFHADDDPSPKDSYGVSKYEAELALRQLAEETGLEVVIIRPPLVYGSEVKANFLAIMKLVKLGVPLPLGCVDNKRSLVYIENLVDFILVCVDHPAAANQVFLVSDGEDLSTTELLRRMANACGRRSRLLPVPIMFLRICAGVFGKQDVAQRLLGSLQVDIRKSSEMLGWKPAISIDEGLRRICWRK